MKLARTGIIAAAILAVSSVAFAQKPDFTGTWTPDASAAQAPAAGGGGQGGGGGRGMGGGGPLNVTHKGDTLTVERSMGETKMSTVYKLDGTESVNKQSMGRGENAREVEVRSMAKWDGNSLVITSKRPGQDGAMVETSEKWTVDGSTLTIESTNARGTQKRVYKK